MSVQRQVPKQSLRRTAIPTIPQWGDVEEDQLVSLQKSIETRMEELERKETQVNNLLKLLEAKERDMKLESMSSSMFDGKELLVFLNEYVDHQEKLHDGVYGALKSSKEPAKLVLDAVKQFYCNNWELGIGESVLRRSCVILLEQLTRLEQKVVPAEVKAEAAILAREWRAKIRIEEGQRGGVLEVLGFLLLLGAYDLVDEFDICEMLSVFESIGQQSGQAAEASELGIELFLADKDPVGTTLDAQEKTKRSSREELEVVNQIASSFTSRLEVLKFFCNGMDGRSLKLFLYEQVEEHDSLCNEVCYALSQAPDPAKLVLDAIPGFLPSQPEFDKNLTMAKVRKSCILLLEQLMTISPRLSSHVRVEALKMADDWGANLGQIYQRPVTVYGFLLFLAAYGLNSNYEADKLLHLLGIASQYKASPVLSQVLGLADKAEVIIQTLLQKALLLEAIDNIYAYELMDKFEPVRLLKGYLKYSKKRIYKKGNKSKSQEDQAIDREIAVMRIVINYIAKYKLESKYPPEELEKQIVELENKKEPKVDTMSTRTKKLKLKGKSKVPSPSYASSIVHTQVKVEPSQNEYSKMDNQITSFSSGPWPQLEPFCISTGERGSRFSSHDHMEKHESLASSSTSRWPELKSFCISTDGKGLRLFLYNHADEHAHMCSEVWDALQYASDPAKLVLDAIPGFLLSQPEFDKSLSLNKIRKSNVILLEQLITISPAINPHVKQEALKMANEWRANLGQAYQTGLNVYGFLHFIAVYGFTSNYEADELLGLLETANEHKASPGLCRILGLADKVVDLILSLIQKTLLLEAIEHIHAFNLGEMFETVQLLEEYLTQSKKKIYKKGTNSVSKQAIDREIDAVRTVIKCIAKYKLESECQPKNLESYINELEKQKSLMKTTLHTRRSRKGNVET